ncbi:MAG: ClpX C4-type zinc finger protein, partial [Myxococcaceae bacterium]
VERGPTLADPAIPAWCSFCCRPIREVGPLVAGPAGAFICLPCIGEARGLLSKQPVPEPPPEAARTEAAESAAEFTPQPTVRTFPPPFDTDPGEGAASHRTVTESELPAAEAAPAPAPVPEAPPAPAAAPGLPPMVEFTGQAEAMKVLDAAMRLNARLVLILGPEGCGKTAYLRDLERRGLGHYVCDSSTAAKAPKEQRLLIDASGPRQGQLSEADLPWLLELFGSANRQAFVAMRGEPGPPSFAVKSEDTELPMYSSNELVAATGGRLSAALASQVQVTAPFRQLTVAELTEIARRLAVGRASELDLSEELLAALADEAARSGRGGRELESLITRLPSGSWNLQPGAKAKKARKPRKRSEPKEP